MKIFDKLKELWPYLGPRTDVEKEKVENEIKEEDGKQTVEEEEKKENEEEIEPGEEEEPEETENEEADEEFEPVEKTPWEKAEVTEEEKKILGDIQRVWTQAEIKACIRDVPRDRDRIIMTLIYTTGVRLDELVAITAADVDFVHNTIRIAQRGVGPVRKIRITRDTAEQIRRYLDGRASGKLFQGLKGINEGLTKAAVRAAFFQHAPTGMSVTTLRYHGALNLFRIAHNEASAARFLGVDPHPSIREKLEAMEKIQDRMMEAEQRS